MGDSDDEYDRKRRDKFRGERTESYSRESRRGSSSDSRRDDWNERESPIGGSRQVSRSTRGDYRDYRGNSTRERYSPAPSVKRFKGDGWEDRRYGADYAPYGAPWAHEYGPTERSYATPHTREPPSSGGLETQPAMMSFKAFLQSQDDSITDEEAMAKYNEYKLEFKRQQLNEFFVAHKDEEWFKVKYHPEESVKRKEEQLAALKNRVAIFTEFLEKGLIDAVRLDADQSEALIRLMDCVVVRLEGGDESDLKALETAPQPQPKPKETEPAPEEKPFVLEESDEEKDKKKDDEDKPIEPMQLDIDQKQVELQNQAKEFSKQNAQEEDEEDDDDAAGAARTKTTTTAAESASASEAVKNDETTGGEEKKKRKREYDFESGSESEEEKPAKNDLEEPPPPGEEEEKVKSEGNKGKDSDSEGENERGNQSGSEREAKEDKGKKKKKTKEEEDEDEDVVEVENRRRDLHKTSSIFLRNLAPTITKAEVEAMCRRYPGFLRVALAEPQAERRWFRRGWVTFERHVNIKEICWNLNNIRLRDCELGAIVNKDLTRRVRTVNGITSHKQVVRHDIKIAAKMTHTLDGRNGLWSEPSENGVESGNGGKQTESSFGLMSNNPVLKNITDYLIEEASAEEEELLGTTDAEDGQIEDTCTIERDDSLIKVLDRLLLYLRIVYSIDYYNHCEYPQEDEMPNRCGLIHARGLPPTAKVSQQEIQDYCKQFEAKISLLVAPTQVLSSSELAKLGAKDPEKEVEKFIQANTQELSKDKWLCPLSGKKFKGPDFVRKHIQNKHAEKVQEVIKEVEYFNNYLADPKRPQLAEHPGNKAPARREPEPFNPPAQGPPAYAPHYAPYGYAPRGGFYGYGVRGMRGAFRGRGGPPAQDFRQVIHYRDLDAPREPDEFI